MWSPRSPDSSADAGKKGASGGFGSFGSAPARQDSGAQPGLQKSGSVLSQRLNKGSAEANALRTLEARRAAEQAANAPPEIRPAPSSQPSGGQYGSGNGGQYGNNSGGQYNGNRNGQYGGNGMPAPIIVPQNNNGMGNAILGFLLGRSMSNSHANSGYQGNTNNSGMVGTTPGSAGPVATAQAPQESSLGKSLLRTFVWLVILSVLAWGAYLGWKFLRRGKAPSTANYTFDRN
ncbi:hypothetical protein [Massilia frigida]|uniref:hypothetical protein n=1 Tax=Massilia frigida TaxID=2609281 RepID=UPI00141E742E|nr:hypothetical protein [Massilia frigida]